MLSVVTPRHARASTFVVPSALVVAALMAIVIVALRHAATIAAQPGHNMYGAANVSGKVSVPSECTWNFLASPNTHQYNSLNGVAAISSDDVWAVGSRGDSFTGELTLIEHWNGSAWSIVPSPNPGGESNELMGVSALSANDIWAVGYHSQASSTFILHWDGIAWTHIPSPNVGNLENELRSVVAISADDVWAVGYYWGDPNRRRTLTLHWNGTEWSLVSSPSVGPFDNYLLSVTATASNDVWAVGSYVADSGRYQTLTLHWNGSDWTVTPSPNAPDLNNFVNGVSAISANDVWSVGYTCQGNCFSTIHRHLVMHWEGSEWSLVATPDIAPYVWLNAVEALSSNDVWAVGLYSTGTEAGPLALHWDGEQWSQAPAINPGSSSPEFKAISALSSNDIWATGVFHFTGNPVFRTLTEHYTGTCPPASVTPVSPTATSVPPTVTATHETTSTPTLPAPTISPTSVATGIATSTVPAPTLTPTVQPTCEGTWRTYEMQPDGGYAQAVSASTSGDVWSVGFVVGPIFVPNAQRWDGTAWERVLSNELNNGGGFYDVLVISPNDVWAAGAEWTRLFDSWPEVAHWDGTSWTRQEFPSPDLESRFYGIASVDASDIWAVGSYVDGRYRALIYHYDGVLWQQVASPELPERAGLSGVTAVAANDVWAVGYTGDYGVETSLIEHWDGTAWSVVSTPSVGSLSGVEAISTTDVWAVGDDGILHWNGNSWNIVPSPSGAKAVSAISPVDVWAVGANSVLHWDGVEWRVVTNLPAELTDVVALSPGDVWVVGNAEGAGHISFHYTSQQFIDVPPGNTFYSQVQCLACRGIISGYSDGTFRPNNQVTRGQLAKIVSNSAGYSETITGQTFQDVPPTHTFYEFIERLTHRGHMTGYPCGGPGEPCINNMPYFRPFANATRGQTSKIVSNAAGFNEAVSGQVFEDVPPTHTFYEFIQRLASRNVMQGYPCGGPGEPCVNNMPYFRPQNDVTRGQSAKIVANTFFPGCDTTERR